MSQKPELTDAQKAEIRMEAEAFGLGYAEGLAQGKYEGRQDLIETLTPYVQHIGNCGSVGRDPEDSRCICGLHQVWLS